MTSSLAISRDGSRRAWIEAIGLAVELGKVAALAADPQYQAGSAEQRLAADKVIRLMGAVRPLSGQNFPVESHSARVSADAFLILAKLFVAQTTGPEARRACAGFLVAGAECLDATITKLRDAESQSWRSRTGERDDD